MLDKKSDIPPARGLAAAFILLAVLLRPWSVDVPLNDDWSYLIPTLRLARDGVLRVTGDSPTTHVLHVLAGALWSKVFGGGIGRLKLLMFLWHFTGAFFLLRLLLEERVQPALARLAALTYVFNPILLTLSVTFMTDIPYLTLVIVSMYGYLRALREDSDAWLLCGALAAGGAYLVKQLGLFLPVAATLVLWRCGRLSRRRPLYAWAPLLLAFAGHQFWYHFIHGPTWAGTADGVYPRAFGLLGNPAVLIRDGSLHAVSLVLYSALFLLPLLAGFARLPGPGERRPPPRHRRRHFLAVALGRPRPALLLAIFGLSALALVVCKGKFPYLENSFYHTGIGTPTAAGTSDKAAGFFAWPLFWEGVTAACVLGGLRLLTLLRSRFAERGRDPAALLLAFTALLQLGVPFLTTRYFDRYLLYGLPALIGLLCLTGARERFSFRAGWAVFALTAAVYVCAARDYAAWNGAKWRLGRAAMERGTAAEAIAGGFDWDMYWTYEKKMAELTKVKPLKDIREWEWLETLSREAVISFTPPRYAGGRELIAEEPYSTPLSFADPALYLYRKKTGP